MNNASNKEQAIGCLISLVVIALTVVAFVAIGNYREAQAEKKLPPIGFLERIEVHLRPRMYAEKEIARVARIVEAQQNMTLQMMHHSLTRNLPEIARASFDIEDVTCDDSDLSALTSFTSRLLDRRERFGYELDRFANNALVAAASRRNVREKILEALPEFADDDDYYRSLSLRAETTDALLITNAMSSLPNVEALCLSLVDVEPVFIFSQNANSSYPVRGDKGSWERGSSPVTLSVRDHPEVPELALQTLTYQLFSSETSPAPSRQLFSPAPFLTFSGVKVGEKMMSITELQATCPEEASLGDVYTTTFYAFPSNYGEDEPTQAFSFPVVVVCQGSEEYEGAWETPEAAELEALSQSTLDAIERVTYCGSDLDPLLNLRILTQKSRDIRDMRRQDYDDEVVEALSRVKGYDVRLANEQAIANAEVAFMAELQEARAILDASCYREVRAINDVVAESTQYDDGSWGRISLGVTIKIDAFPGELSRFSRSGFFLQIVRLSEDPDLDNFPLPKYSSLFFDGDSFVRMRNGIQITSFESFPQNECPENAQVGDEYHATYYAYPLSSYDRLKGFEFDVTLRCVAESQN